MTALRAGAATHVGRVRAANQDAYLVGANVYAVADGMGGHAAGEVASAIAIQELGARVELSLDGVVRAVRYANRAVWARAEDDPALRGMGTTLCAIALVPADPSPAGPVGADADRDPDATGVLGGDRVVVANVGDSRVYLFHDGVLEQISEDHSLVGELVRDGRLSYLEARSHPQRNVLTRVLGHDTDVDVDAWEIVPYVGDRFLLCSDGLFNEVTDEGMVGVLRRLADPGEAAHELVRLANDGGGRDNISVVVVDVVDGDDGTAAALHAPGRPSPVVTPAPPPAPPAAPPAPAVRPDEAAPAPAPTRPAAPTRAPRTRALTWRVVLYVLLVLAVVAAGVAAVLWYARGTYFVGVDSGEVVVFQGRPEGVLWFEPTVEERTGIDADQLPSALQGDLADGKLEPSLAEARAYVDTLEERAADFGAPVQTTTTTSLGTSTTVGGAPGTDTTTAP